MSRCVNIDWLEVYCLEDISKYPCNADFFRQQGWIVDERDYGTRQYNEMFILRDSENEPFLEVRRNPKSEKIQGIGVFEPQSCHLRLTNRYCYFDNAVEILAEFLARYGYELRRIFRLDICYDFEKFDSGDLPADFLKRYLRDVYRKVNVSIYKIRGKDRWDGKTCNYISWGNPTSMISTKFYNKSLELGEANSKPWIKQAWFAAGLVDNPITCQKFYDEDGTRKSYVPEIWRVEFTIRSSARKWYTIENVDGRKVTKQAIPHTLDLYTSRDKLWNVWLSLSHHYFHFKIKNLPASGWTLKFIPAPGSKAARKNPQLAALKPHVDASNKIIYKMDGDELRKDLCRDKTLFSLKENRTFYKLEGIAKKGENTTELHRLLKKLYSYRVTHYDEDILKAVDILISNIDKELVRNTRVTKEESRQYVWDILEKHLQFNLPNDAHKIETIGKFRDLFFNDNIDTF